ncbi:hypothetical protein MUU75_17705 [Pseudoxanthomonas mexicana]|uniref:hypothetical protein n=1 Tax=Pseudoxanthomonas mexicana TaxID=128785 RepID=UPI001FD6A647|nr:hypothetical protein [Pseudoxanthomonas mexicana]UOV04888.1 hypothetical protein MUU75_17705 [Pseudoxanthomonas mexicana]
MRIKTHFADLLDRSMSDIDVATINRWWSDRLTPADGKRAVERITAHRDFATLRAACPMPWNGAYWIVTHCWGCARSRCRAAKWSVSCHLMKNPDCEQP